MGLINLKHKAKLYWLYRSAVTYPPIMTQPSYWASVVEALLSIKEIRLMLAGYKTYIMALALGVTAAAHGLGYITKEQAEVFYGLFGAGGMATMSAKINRNADR